MNAAHRAPITVMKSAPIPMVLTPVPVMMDIRFNLMAIPVSVDIE